MVGSSSVKGDMGELRAVLFRVQLKTEYAR